MGLCRFVPQRVAPAPYNMNVLLLWYPGSSCHPDIWTRACGQPGWNEVEKHFLMMCVVFKPEQLSSDSTPDYGMYFLSLFLLGCSCFTVLGGNVFSNAQCILFFLGFHFFLSPSPTYLHFWPPGMRLKENKAAAVNTSVSFWTGARRRWKTMLLSAVFCPRHHYLYMFAFKPILFSILPWNGARGE